jgi:hypothetical protein
MERSSSCFDKLSMREYVPDQPEPFILSLSKDGGRAAYPNPSVLRASASTSSQGRLPL